MVKKQKNLRLEESLIQEIKLEAVKQKTNDSKLVERYIKEGLLKDNQK